MSATLARVEPSIAEVGDYIALMKPRVMSLVVFTALVGLVVAPGHVHPVIALTALLCIAVGAGAAGALNMWWDSDIAALMARTRLRAVPLGLIAPGEGEIIADLVIATNRNDILARFFNDGSMALRPVEPSLSPSMDIQVSSNFERLLFDLLERDAGALGRAMTGFRTSGSLQIGAEAWRAARSLFAAHAVSDDETLDEIARNWRGSGVLVDPHSAVALAAASS